jgi:hypothetical protein
MWDLISCEECTYSTASSCLLYRFRDFLGSLEYSTIVWFRDISEVIYLDLGDDQSMSESSRVYIEECIHIGILIDLIGWDIPCYDTSEESGHANKGRLY